MSEKWAGELPTAYSAAANLRRRQMPCASSSELHQPPRLEAVGNGRALFSATHTTCHRNLRLEKTEMQGSWMVSAAPHQQTEAIGAAVVDSAELAKGAMLPAARWTSCGRCAKLVLGGLRWPPGRQTERPDTNFLPPTQLERHVRQLPIGRAWSGPSRPQLGAAPPASSAAPLG